jgi:hypothetical protein
LHKFMVALDERVFLELDTAAKTRNISIQELLRAIVVPEWLRQDSKGEISLAESRRRE